jgi:hypothetical protein
MENSNRGTILIERKNWKRILSGGQIETIKGSILQQHQNIFKITEIDCQ